MTEAASVIVPNWHRRESLLLALEGLAQQRQPAAEVIVVSDLAAAPCALPLPVIWRQGDRPNVSRARNIGLAAARSPLVAFLDDDAVPEPDWLASLTEAMTATTALAGGPVLGPNGWSLQWGARAVALSGEDVALDDPAACLPKINGTNMILRRAALEQAGGFDERFAYYLDETDMALRLAALGHRPLWVPAARVHHGYARSTHRSGRRVPSDLFETGRSITTFLATHTPEAERAAARYRHLDAQTRRLRRFHHLGLLDLREMRRLLERLREGLAAPVAAPLIPALAPQAAPLPPPAPLAPARSAPLRIAIVPTILTRRRAWADAQALRATGAEVSLLEFRYSPRPLRVRFTQGGIWHHLGGCLRRPAEGSGLPLRIRYAAGAELARIAPSRRFTHVLGYDLRGARRLWAITGDLLPTSALFSTEPAEWPSFPHVSRGNDLG